MGCGLRGRTMVNNCYLKIISLKSRLKMPYNPLLGGKNSTLRIFHWLAEAEAEVSGSVSQRVQSKDCFEFNPIKSNFKHKTLAIP